jgi:multisubunit Na+/H+ antiporter MnhG subunit
MVWVLFRALDVIELYLSPSRCTFLGTPDLLIAAVLYFLSMRFGRLAQPACPLDRLCVGVVTAEAVWRGKTVLTRKVLHFVLLAIGIIVSAWLRRSSVTLPAPSSTSSGRDTRLTPDPRRLPKFYRLGSKGH